jgi:hypothetical protein
MLEFDRSRMVLMCAATLLAACSKAAKPSEAEGGDAGASERDAAVLVSTRFVGAVEDSDARVAIVRGGTYMRLFFCGGPDSVASATQWFNLDTNDDDVTITTPWQVSAHVASDAVTGQVTRDDGIVRNFSAKPIADGTLAGLYEGKGDCGRLGLIVTQPDKSAEVSTQGACVGDGHVPEQVNPILPVSLDEGTIAVQAPGGNAGETAQLMAAALQAL